MIRPTRDLPRASAPTRRRWLHRMAVGATAVAAVIPTALLVLLGPGGTGWAADQPSTITIVGDGMTSPISVRSDTQEDVYSALLRQVSWMAGRSGDFAKPNLSTLGAKYTLTIFTKGVASAVYNVYPEAAGGPRAQRPANQPKGGGAEAWFYATVTLPSVLRAAGVPLPQPTASGHPGGTGYEDPQYQPDSITAASPFSFTKELSQARLALAATAAVAVTILMLLFGAARVSRRRWSR